MGMTDKKEIIERIGCLPEFSKSAELFLKFSEVSDLLTEAAREFSEEYLKVYLKVLDKMTNEQKFEQYMLANWALHEADLNFHGNSKAGKVEKDLRKAVTNRRKMKNEDRK